MGPVHDERGFADPGWAGDGGKDARAAFGREKAVERGQALGPVDEATHRRGKLSRQWQCPCQRGQVDRAVHSAYLHDGIGVTCEFVAGALHFRQLAAD
ncbi:hypothetical protein GCM10011574_04700 [Microbispora bryophytorum]|uniref:Uncharacterized protein n=1 Tax=Microbispora bryophytorum TaxID=1460882 RepID=A0A8H9GZY9_9ACTN|nr:hypothetical protein GCM10011574_04700 [Microbispora bryophytorum]